MRYRIGGRERPATVLVSFPLTLFALMALAALVIDLGWVRVAQRQMQTAVDAAALEGLRGENTDAHEIAAWTFDEDFDPSADSRAFGAGPRFGLTPGIPGSEAFQRITLDHPQVYDPSLQLNLDNALHGDMVRGAYALTTLAADLSDPSDTSLSVVSPAGFPTTDGYLVGIEQELLQVTAGAGTGTWTVLRGADGTTSSLHPVGAVVTLADRPREGTDYGRNDFSPSGTGAFLVRMRRTRDLQGNARNPLDDQPGTSAAENALPLVFGRVSLLRGGNPADGYSPRAHGIAVRATAIAAGRPVLCAGAPNVSFDLKGLTPFGFSLVFWNALPPDQAVTATLNATTGELTVPSVVHGGAVDGWATMTTVVVSDDTASITVASGNGFVRSAPFRIRIGNEVLQVTSVSGIQWTVERGREGTTQAAHPAGAAVRQVDPVATGQPFLRGLASGFGISPLLDRYVPIFSPLGGVERVVGFGYVEVAMPSSSTLLFTKRAGRVASENASAVRPTALDGTVNVTDLLGAQGSVSDALAAPVLVR